MPKSKKIQTGTVTVRQTGSAIGSNDRVRATLTGLGLGRIGKQRTLNDTAPVRGMIAKVQHLVHVVPGASA